jgi:hypothetical protein
MGNSKAQNVSGVGFAARAKAAAKSGPGNYDAQRLLDAKTNGNSSQVDEKPERADWVRALVEPKKKSA